jgi:GTP cyclohydrolase I
MTELTAPKIESYGEYDYDKMKQSCTLFLEALGEDPTRDGLIGTPDRVARMWLDIAGGYNIDPKKYIVTFDADTDDMVVVKDIRFYSFCEHHIQLFTGTIHIGYIPNGKVIGLSKLVRLARVYCKRLQIQERLTQQIADLIFKELDAKGVIVQIEAEHFCMSIRGVRLPNTTTVTTALRGQYKKDEKACNQFKEALK